MLWLKDVMGFVVESRQEKISPSVKLVGPSNGHRTVGGKWTGSVATIPAQRDDDPTTMAPDCIRSEMVDMERENSTLDRVADSGKGRIAVMNVELTMEKFVATVVILKSTNSAKTGVPRA